MQCDSAQGLLYVLGGKIGGSDLCSGLYVYRVADNQWQCLCPDQASAALSNQPQLPRSAHVLLLHPVRNNIY